MKMMFLYESLSEHEKQIIDIEVERAIKEMILTIKSFDYNESDFLSVVNEMAIKNKEIDRLLGGKDLSHFNLKATVINSKALKVAYDIEHSKPSLERLEYLLRLCIALEVEPYSEMFFDSELVESLIVAYENYINKDEKILEKVVDLNNIMYYTKSSNTIWFTETMYELHATKTQNANRAD